VSTVVCFLTAFKFPDIFVIQISPFSQRFLAQTCAFRYERMVSPNFLWCLYFAAMSQNRSMNRKIKPPSHRLDLYFVIDFLLAK